jgi:CheY-like chemotaxis protein
VLVVDDDREVREWLALLLGDEHLVRVAPSGAQALVALRSGARFDAIFCDVQMSGMTGLELHARLSVDFPDQADAIVFLIGPCPPAIRARLARLKNACLYKPIDAGRLRAVLGQQLGAAAGGR